MTKVLKEAIAEVATLPESDQELIGRELLVHVEKLRSLRAYAPLSLQSSDNSIGAVFSGNPHRRALFYSSAGGLT